MRINFFTNVFIILVAQVFFFSSVIHAGTTWRPLGQMQGAQVNDMVQSASCSLHRQ